MCSIAAAQLVVALVGTASAVSQAQTQEQIASHNATALSQQAQAASERGAYAVNLQRSRVQRALAAQQVAAGSSGAAVESKSFSEIMGETAALGEADAQIMRLNAAREAWGLEQQAAGVRWQGKADKQAGLWGAAGTALSGFTGAYKQAVVQGGGTSPKWW